MNWAALPGGDLVAEGLSDLASSRESVPGALVSIGAPRLRALGLSLPTVIPDPERRLYELLAAGGEDSAHGRYNALDIDFVIQSEDDSILRELPAMKERLEINLELASPLDFIPVPEGWEDRSPLIKKIGNVSFHHFDPYGQVLAKIERGHARDVNPRTSASSILVQPRRRPLRDVTRNASR